MRTTVAIVALVGVLWASNAAAESSREQVLFSYGWRFRMGVPPVNCSPDTFPQNLSGVECMGLKAMHGDPDASAAACRDACCGAGAACAIWQWSAAPAPGGGCWAGQSTDCSHNSNAWVGGGRDVPPPGPNSTTPPEGQSGYDDSSWALVDAPHDFIINQAFNEDTPGSGESYLARNSSWYRKHFNVPAEWKGSTISVRFEGVFKVATAWLNGQQLGGGYAHMDGYTQFEYRLDNETLHYGTGSANENVIAMFVDGSSGSEWWYAGAGIYRNCHLIRTAPLHVASNGVFAPSWPTGEITARATPAAGLTSSGALVSARAEVRNDGSSATAFSVRFTLFDASGASAATVTAQGPSVSPGSVAKVEANVSVTSAVELWSVPRPYLYSLTAEVLAADGNTVVDNSTVPVGVRSLLYSGTTGLWVNGQHVKVRGFCDHDDFEGVGMALYDRINLFRAQSVRGLGGNGWRMSHNPPLPSLLDTLDRLGVVVMNEHRNFENTSSQEASWTAMLRRDRNHPSIVVLSFCNEAGCERAEEAGPPFQKIADAVDGTRPTLANMFTYNDLLSDTIDVQGFSHRPGSVFDSYHQSNPHKAVFASECCSCETERGEDVSNPKGTPPVRNSNFNAGCVAQQTNWSNGRDFVVGSMVWTGLDYYGESHGWPYRSSSYGSYDLSGFSKAAAYWYRSWWLSSVPVDAADRPPIGVHRQAHIVQAWQPSVVGQAGADSRTVQGYTDAASAELFVNGASLGVKNVAPLGYAEWDNVAYAPGNATMVARDGSGGVVATHTRLTAGSAVALQLSIDAPSPSTGTGAALLADGQDVALLRVVIIDAAGSVVPTAANNVTFAVTSGPGRVLAAGNGDPRNHEPTQAPWKSAYHGLVRGIVQVTVDAASPAWHRGRMREIDADGGVRTRVATAEDAPPASIVVTASSSGLKSASITIPVSTDAAKDSVLAAAAASVGSANLL